MLSFWAHGCTPGGLPGVLPSEDQMCTPGGFPGVLSSLVHTWRASRGTLFSGPGVHPWRASRGALFCGSVMHPWRASRGTLFCGPLVPPWRTLRVALFGAPLEGLQGCSFIWPRGATLGDIREHPWKPSRGAPKRGTLSVIQGGTNGPQQRVPLEAVQGYTSNYK